MNLDVVLYQRNFSEVVRLPELQFQVNRYSHHAVGGPEAASITAYGDENALGELLWRLRTPVEIIDEQLEPVWWGYIASVTVRIGVIEIGVSLDTMANKVACAYSSIAAGSQTPGTRATTTWASDSASIAMYGTKELLVSLSGATAAQANAARDRVLAARKNPVPILRHNPGQSSLSATLDCRGWWSTLAWRYYTNTGTNSVETTTQISNIITSVGQFITGVYIKNASGISSSEYRDGDTTAADIIKELMDSGTVNNRRVLASISRDRLATIYEEPERLTGEGDMPTLLLDTDGHVYDRWGTEMLSHTCPVAQWAGIKEISSLNFKAANLADVTWLFIERAEFDAASQRLQLETRDIPSPWDIAKVRAG